MSPSNVAPNTTLPTFGQRALLYGAPLLMALALWLHGPIEQWASYHHFADVHTLWGIPNAANVWSNLPFLLIGVWGWVALLRQRHPQPNTLANVGPSFHAWCLFAFSIA